MEKVQKSKFSTAELKHKIGFPTTKMLSSELNTIPINQQIKTNQNCLSNIVELTEEHEPQDRTLITQNYVNLVQASDGKLSQPSQQEKNQQQTQSFLKRIKNWLSKGVGCVSFTYSKIRNHFKSQNINIQESQVSEMLSRLRKKKSKKITLLPPLQQETQLQNSNNQLQPCKRTLVFELDETLIFLTYRKPQKYDFTIEIETKGKKMTAYIVKRFGLDSLLFSMAKIYQVVIWSTLKAEIIQQIVEKIDPKKNISHWLTWYHCLIINKMYYVKSVRQLGRDPKSVITIDSQPISAALNPQNLYKIQPFRGSSKDHKLLKLSHFLTHLHESRSTIPEIIPVQRLRRQFQTKQIHLTNQKQNKQPVSKTNEKNKNNKLSKQYNLVKKRGSEFQNIMKEIEKGEDQSVAVFNS